MKSLIVLQIVIERWLIQLLFNFFKLFYNLLGSPLCERKHLTKPWAPLKVFFQVKIPLTVQGDAANESKTFFLLVNSQTTSRLFSSKKQPNPTTVGCVNTRELRLFYLTPRGDHVTSVGGSVSVSLLNAVKQEECLSLRCLERDCSLNQLWNLLYPYISFFLVGGFLVSRHDLAPFCCSGMSRFLRRHEVCVRQGQGVFTSLSHDNWKKTTKPCFREIEVRLFLVSDMKVAECHPFLLSGYTMLLQRRWSSSKRLINSRLALIGAHVVLSCFFFPSSCALWLREAERTSRDLSKESAAFQSGTALCLNSQQFTAENIEAAVSIQLCVHAHVHPPIKNTHTRVHSGLVCCSCDEKHLFYFIFTAHVFGNECACLCLT